TGRAIPAAARATLAHLMGSDVTAGEADVSFYPARCLVLGSDTTPETIPGMIVFANDGGGKRYFLDATNRLGCGAWAVFEGYASMIPCLVTDRVSNADLNKAEL